MSSPLQLPSRDQVTEPPKNKDGSPNKFVGLMRRTWLDFMSSLVTQQSLSPERVGTVSLPSQAASIGTTAVGIDTINAGLYRVQWYWKIRRAGGVSSSMQVTMNWTDGGVARQNVGPADITNTTAVWQSQVFMVRSDAASPITYSTTYASAGAPTMQYDLDITVERVHA